MACLRGWHASMGGIIAWVAWMAYLCGWHANVDYVVGVLAWVMWVVYVCVFTCVLFGFGVISQITN